MISAFWRGWGALALAVLIVPAAACAQAASSAHVDIELRATVAERCGISRAGSDPTTADLDSAQNLRFGFHVDCNAPFAIAVSSANGALRMQQDGAIVGGPNASRTPDGFALDKAYQVALTLDTDSDPISTQPCSSRDLVGAGKTGNCPFYGTVPGSGLSSGNRTAMGRDGALLVSWKAGDEGGIRHAAGIYQDTLTVVVGPRT